MGSIFFFILLNTSTGTFGGYTYGLVSFITFLLLFYGKILLLCWLAKLADLSYCLFSLTTTGFVSFCFGFSKDITFGITSTDS